MRVKNRIPKRKSLYGAAAMAVCLLMAAAVMAADFTVSGTETASKIINANNETGTVAASGELAVTKGAGEAKSIVIIGGMGGTLENITLSNQGIVSAESTRTAAGIFSETSILKNSSIENTQSFFITSTGETSAPGTMDSIALFLQYLDNTSINNSGTISVTGTRSPVGIHVWNWLFDGSSITNTGTISLDQTATAWTEGVASGIFVSEILGAAVLNAGTLSVTSPIGGVGINSNKVQNGSITNSGLIRINAPQGTGIQSSSALNGSIVNNSGQISLNGAQGTGISVTALGNGAVVKNTGSISVTQTGAGRTGYGISVPRSQSAAAAITNTGSITLTTMDPSSTACGVFSGGPASFENTGTIMTLDSTGAMGANMYSVKTGGTVNNGGTLKGLFEARDTTNSGWIAMPALPSAITGNYTQTGNGSLGITLFSDDNPANTKYSKLVVSGTANLAPGSGFDVDVTTASALQELLIGQTLTGVIESAGGITADPATLYVTDNSALLRFIPVLSLGDTCLDLGVEKGMTIAQAAAMGGYAGASGAAAALDTLTGSANPQISAFIADLNTLPTETGVGRRVQQAAPVSVAQGPAMATQMANTVSSVVQARQQGLKGFNSGDPVFSEKNAWVKPYASRVDQDGVDGVSGFRADTYGIGMGADGEFTQGNFGLAFFYTHAETRTNDTPQETDLDLFSLMAYGSRPVMGNTVNIDYQLGGGLAPTDSSRYIQSLGTSAAADYTSKNLFARAKASRELALAENAKAIVGPALSYLWFYTPSYEETGAGGMSLNVDSLDAQSLVAALEGDVVWSFPKDIEVMASASLGYDVINDTTFVSSQFQGGGAIFRTKGLDNSPLVYGAGLGLCKKFGDQFSIEAKYDLEGRGSDLLTQMVSARLNWRF